jgi:tetratricopeptide (TPR) repeat protein
MSVARSLYKRNHIPLEKGLDLWNSYNRRIIKILKDYELPYTFIRYESLISNPEIHQKVLERKLNVQMGDAWRFIDNKLNRSETEDSDLPRQIEDAYKNIINEWDNTEGLLKSLDDQDLKAGEMSFQQGDLEKAKEYFYKVLERFPNHAEAYNNLGVIEFCESKYDEAIGLFNKSLESDKNYFDALINKANCLKNKENHKEAIDEYNKAYIIDNDNIEILNSLGECYLKIEDLRNAYVFYSKSFELDNDQTLIKAIVDKLKLPGIRDIKSEPVSKKIGTPVSVTGERKIRFCITSFADTEIDPERKLRWGDHWVKLEIQNELEKRGHIVTDINPDVILHLFGAPLKNLPKDSYNILWIHSHPDLMSQQILKEYDKIYCLSPLFLEKIRKWGFDADLLIGGTAKSPVIKEKCHDIVFVGNAKNLPLGRKIISDLSKTTHMNKLKVWGEGWETIIPKENFGGIYYENNLLPELYASSYIVLNDHHEDMRREGFLNPRILDVFASGSFVISDDIKGLDQVFGDALVTYKNPDDLDDLINHYLENDDDRERIIKKGQEISLNFSFSSMVEKILNDIERSEVLQSENKSILSSDGSSDASDGHQFLEKGIFHKAEECFKSALRKDGRNIEAVFGLAKLYIEKGQNENALNAFKKCLSIHPQNKNAKNLLKQILLDSITSKSGEIIPLHQYTYVHIASDTEDLELEMTPAVIVAFHMISKFNPDMSLLLYSFRALKDYPWEVIDIVRQNSNICFKEVAEETIDIGKGSIFVYLAESPSLKKYLTSALSLGIPVICTDTTPTEDMIQNGYTGLLVKTEEKVRDGSPIINLNDLAKKMYFLGQDPELIHEMSVNIQQEFSGPDKVASPL